jgi:hypothetical protein
MPATTARELYTQAVRDLPLTERLQLAALILEGLSQPNVAVVDASDTWTDEDQQDLAAFSVSYATARFPERAA